MLYNGIHILVYVCKSKLIKQFNLFYWDFLEIIRNWIVTWVFSIQKKKWIFSRVLYKYIKYLQNLHRKINKITNHPQDKFSLLLYICKSYITNIPQNKKSVKGYYKQIRYTYIILTMKVITFRYPINLISQYTTSLKVCRKYSIWKEIILYYITILYMYILFSFNYVHFCQL